MMDDRHLAWMDTQRAAKPHVAGKLNGVMQTCGVLDRGKDAVERRGQAGDPGAEHYRVAGVAEERLGGAATGGQVQVQSQIKAAER
ncbi:hypothetical protein D3C86_1612800 [compost metagenome]